MTTPGQAYLLYWGSRAIDPAGVPLGQQGGAIQRNRWRSMSRPRKSAGIGNWPH